MALQRQDIELSLPLSPFHLLDCSVEASPRRSSTNLIINGHTENHPFSLFIAVILPIVAKIPLAFAQVKSGGYDNRNPRGQQATLTGFGARAKAAHENSFEALILFTPGVIAVMVLNVPSIMVQYTAMVFIVARIVYLIMYWIDQHLLRSIAWGIGYGASLYLIWQAIIQTVHL